MKKPAKPEVSGPSTNLKPQPTGPSRLKPKRIIHTDPQPEYWTAEDD